MRAVTGLVLALRLLLYPLLGSQSPFIFFVVAIVVSGVYGGFGPGLLSTLLSAAAANYFLFSPYYDLKINNASDVILLGIFVAVGVMISWLNQTVRTSRQRIEAALDRSTKLQAVLGTRRFVGLRGYRGSNP